MVGRQNLLARESGGYGLKYAIQLCPKFVRFHNGPSLSVAASLLAALAMPDDGKLCPSSTLKTDWLPSGQLGDVKVSVRVHFQDAFLAIADEGPSGGSIEHACKLRVL
jgi:hypothetical protein